MPVSKTWSTHNQHKIVNDMPAAKHGSEGRRKTSTTAPKMMTNKPKQRKKRDPEAERRQRARNRFVKAVKSVLAVIRFCNAMREGKASEDSKSKKSSMYIGVKLENTYRITPEDDTRFKSHEAERLVKQILKDMMSHYVYERSSAPKMSRALTSTITDSLKEYIKEHAPRYKIICNVMIGQNLGQGLHCTSRSVWDETTDNYVSVHHKQDNCFAIATVHAAYTP